MRQIIILIFAMYKIHYHKLWYKNGIPQQSKSNIKGIYKKLTFLLASVNFPQIREFARYLIRAFICFGILNSFLSVL